jgi:hypothetical protein
MDNGNGQWTMDNGQWTMDNGEDGLRWLTMAVNPDPRLKSCKDFCSVLHRARQTTQVGWLPVKEDNAARCETDRKDCTILIED